MRKHGCDRDVIDVDQVVEIEPALADSRDEIVGATYTAEDESGDALKYTQELARVCARMGVEFRYNPSDVALDMPIGRAAQVRSVEVSGRRTAIARSRARDIVVGLGSYSAPFLRRYGVRSTSIRPRAIR